MRVGPHDRVPHNLPIVEAAVRSSLQDMEQGKRLIDAWSTALSEVNLPATNNTSGWDWELGGRGQGLRMALELAPAQIATSYRQLKSV